MSNKISQRTETTSKEMFACLLNCFLHFPMKNKKKKKKKRWKNPPFSRLLGGSFPELSAVVDTPPSKFQASTRLVRVFSPALEFVIKKVHVTNTHHLSKKKNTEKQRKKKDRKSLHLPSKWWFYMIFVVFQQLFQGKNLNFEEVTGKAGSVRGVCTWSRLRCIGMTGMGSLGSECSEWHMCGSIFFCDFRSYPNKNAGRWYIL